MANHWVLYQIANRLKAVIAHRLAVMTWLNTFIEQYLCSNGNVVLPLLLGMVRDWTFTYFSRKIVRVQKILKAKVQAAGVLAAQCATLLRVDAARE